METSDYKIPDRELELLARMLLPEIKKFFADDEIKREFELWQAQRETDIKQNKGITVGASEERAHCNALISLVLFFGARQKTSESINIQMIKIWERYSVIFSLVSPLLLY